VIETPTADDLAAIAAALGLSTTAKDWPELSRLTATMILGLHRRLDELEDPPLAIKYPRTAGWRPTAAENRFGGWCWRAEIKGAESGLLAGKSVAIKDNVGVAGLPMVNGSQILEGFIPDADATVVTRILDAGGTIAGKAVCENLCVSSGSHTSASGIARNPHDPARTPGGSSSGSAALVAAGDVDMAVGSDQAGSVRIPASWSGIYGLKPTYGLIPYTGACSQEMTLDHLGPMARSVGDIARLLEAIAGPDGLDPRQPADTMPDSYVAALESSPRGLRIGVVREGFGWTGLSEPDVDDAVREAASAFARLGCRVGEISIPWHRDGVVIWNAICLEGATAHLLDGNSVGGNWKGYYPAALAEAVARGRAARGGELPINVELIMLAGNYLRKKYNGRYYAKARNLSRKLSAAYDDALGAYDLLVMPTVATKAPPIPPPGVSDAEFLARAYDGVVNTSPFDVTGHPAMSVPCALSAGLPVGMMLVGVRGAEATIIRAAAAFEREIFAAPRPAGC